MEPDSRINILEQNCEFGASMDISQLDEEASETFVFTEVAEKRPKPRLKSIVQRALVQDKKRSVYDVVGALQDRPGVQNDWVDQIVLSERRAKKAQTGKQRKNDLSRQSNGTCSTTNQDAQYSSRAGRSPLYSAATKETHPLLPTPNTIGNGEKFGETTGMVGAARKCLPHPNTLLKMSTFGLAVCFHLRFILLALPLAALSCILFYQMGNPSPDFLPDNLSLSWICNFLARHVVLISTACLSEFLLLDSLLLRSRSLIKNTGPFVTLSLNEAKGWPFVVTVWSVLSLFLLHGNNQFQMNWLYATGWAVFSEYNPGNYILSTSEYHNFLVGLLIAGITTTFKRTFLTIVFGNRQFEFFRPRLESLLQDVLVVSEVALLSAKSVDDNGHRRSPSQSAKAFIYSSQRMHIGDTLKTLNFDQDQLTTSETFSEEEISCLEKDDDSIDSKSSSESNTPNRIPPLRSAQFGSSHQNLMKNILDRWEEPHRDDWEDDLRGNIADVLRFQRALQYMDDEYPFGEDFGFAPTRAECVSCSQRLFERLSSLHGKSGQAIPFACFDPLVLDATGSCDGNKRTLIRRLFQPNSNEELDLFAFVQSVE